jgi:hypothetical protein
MTRHSISKGLRILALAIALGFAGTWFALGANTGWTKTSVPVKAIDEITGIESQTWEEQFIPGLEFLGAGLLGATVIGGASFFFRKS